MPMFRLKADIEIEADDIDHAKAKAADLFRDFELADLTVACTVAHFLKSPTNFDSPDLGKGQISLTPTEGPLAGPN